MKALYGITLLLVCILKWNAFTSPIADIAHRAGPQE